MKKTFYTFTLLALLSMPVSGQSLTAVPDWENPAVLGINKLPYHATLQLPSREKECAEIVSLDGQWHFHWSPDPDARPVGFEAVQEWNHRIPKKSSGPTGSPGVNSLRI